MWYLEDESSTSVHHLHPSEQGFCEVCCSLISKLSVFETTGLWELTNQQIVEEADEQAFGKSSAHEY